MKSKSKNPFWVHSPLEESYCKLRMYKYLDQSDCEISIRPKSDFYEKDGQEFRTGCISVFIGNHMGTIETELVLTKKEAREFANYILNMIEALEAENGEH